MQVGGVRHSNRTDRCRVVPQGGRDGCGLPMRVIGRRVCHALRTYNYNPKATKAKPAYPQGCPGGSRGVKAAEAVRRHAVGQSAHSMGGHGAGQPHSVQAPGARGRESGAGLSRPRGTGCTRGRARRSLRRNRTLARIDGSLRGLN